MYTLVVVIVQVTTQFLFLARERNALSPGGANAFLLDGPVKPFNVGIVVGAVQP